MVSSVGGKSTREVLDGTGVAVAGVPAAISNPTKQAGPIVPRRNRPWRLLCMRLSRQCLTSSKGRPRRNRNKVRKNVFHARSGISILSVRASCLTLQDRCFAVCDIQHRRTRAGSRGGGSSPGSCVPPRPGISTTNGKAIERQWMLAARSPSPDGRRLEHHAHALELVQAVRVLRGELTPRLRPQSRRNCPRAGERTTPMYPRTSASG